MTAYLVYREVEGMLEPLGDVDANSPEHAVRRQIAAMHEQGVPTNGTYVSSPKGSTARIEVKVEPSIKITLDSDRVAKPRNRPPAAKKPVRKK